MKIRLSLAQINAVVGDIEGNARKVLDFAVRAEKAGSSLVLFPELALIGYPPEDLLLQPGFLRDAEKALARIARELPWSLAVVLGFPLKKGKALHNAAAVLCQGKIRALYAKQLLPNYGVFDERRYFTPGEKPLLLQTGRARIGVTICEDIWQAGGPAKVEAAAGASLILNLSASPYHAGKLPLRLAMLRQRVRECKSHFAYCNLAGGQDELVFDGASLIMDPKGRVLARAPQFQEALLTADLDLKEAPSRPKSAAVLNLKPKSGLGPLPVFQAPELTREEEIYGALVLGLRDYLGKNGFKKAVLGLSGGIDSSLVACLAVDALGAKNVAGVTMPSRFNSPETRSDAEILAKNLKIQFHEVPIEPLAAGFLKALSAMFNGREPDVTEENLQARIRGVLLMALSNKFGWLVLTTGNKSETSVGYSTLYGDTAGGLAVIKDIPKKLVYDLCRWRNKKEGRALIPQSVFERPPTAELRFNQKDQDSLPPYDVLDKIISLYVEQRKGLPELVKAGIDAATARTVLKSIDSSEHKRRQSPPGIKITPLAFGRDRRMPLTNRYSHGLL